MNVEVSLARHSSPWRFRGSAGLDEWLRRRPWTEAGGVRTVLVDSEASAGRVTDSIRRAVYAADGASSGVCVLPMESRVDDSPWVVLERELELPEARDDRTRRLAVAGYLQGRPPSVLVATPPPIREPAVWHEPVARLCDGLAKEAARAPLTFILVVSGAEWRSFPVDDFTQGEPVEPVLGVHTEAVQLLWPRYVHARVAWEAGGRPGVAARIAEFVDDVAQSNDSAIELGFGAAAQQLWSEVGSEVRQVLLEWLQAGALSKDARRVAALLRQGLLWAPNVGGHPQPIPWVSRALLLGEKRPAPERALLRGGLVCQPLSLELLGRCFALELRLRARAGAVAGKVAPVDADRHFLDFKTRAQHFTRLLYPGGTPALPEDAWGFASLGQLLHALNVPRDSEVKELGELRNALAHGHYAGWAAIQSMRKIEARLQHS